MSKEIEYQNRDQAFIEKLLAQRTGRSSPMYTEEFSNKHDDVLQSHPWIITKSLPTFKIAGLHEKMHGLNHASIAKRIGEAGSNLSVDTVVHAMIHDFQERFSNAANGYETYPLIFSPNTLQHDTTKQRIATVDGIDFPYDVIYYEWMNQLGYQGRNAFSIVREKRIPIAGQGTSHQRPDFAVYINGIPFMFIEYKTEDSGIKEAIADLENKSTYRKVPFYVACNGRDCAVICNIEQFNIKDSTSASAYLWKVHKHTPETEALTDVECFYHEVLCQPENLYFYATQITSLDHQRGIVKNGRIQQYTAVKNFHKHLIATRAQKTRAAANLAVFHTQRSGKTVTMKFIAQLVLNHYSDLFQYIFVYAPDLQIKTVLSNEINAAGGQSLVSIDIIGGDTSKLTFEQVLKQMQLDAQNTTLGVKRIFIVNMQQLKIKAAAVYPGFNVLNIIDEGHHGQAGELADVRTKALPNATNILFTATPKTDTYVHYLGMGDVAEDKILDRFTFTQAKAADIVVNVLYIKPNTFMDAFQKSGKIGQFLDLAETQLGEKFETEAQAYDAISSYADEPAFANSAKSRFAKGLMQKIHEDIVPAKIDQIVEFQQEVKRSLTHEGVVLFEPKAIVYTEDIAHARAYIDALRVLNGGTGNVYKGLRFALDYAALDEDTSLLENDGIGCGPIGKDTPSGIDIAFRNQGTGMRIDVLIAVNKYQKGYDLPELTTVFLDKTIREPSLINQIYTRPATKRRHKTIGYSIDLTLGRTNRSTFDSSVELYDEKGSGSEQFITEEAIKEIQKGAHTVIATLKVHLGLDSTTFTKERILQAVLNPALDSERQPKQAVFFKESKALFKHIKQLKSPLYFKAQRFEITALYHAFVEFKEIYANANHLDHAKIKINLDNSLGDVYLTKEEIKSIIDSVLGVMQEKSLATLLEFKYSAATALMTEGATEGVLSDWAVAQKKEERKADLLKAVKLAEAFLEEKDKTLYELVKELMDKLGDDRNRVYDDSIQEDIVNLLKQVQAHQAAFKAEIASKYQDSAFIYYMVTGLQKEFPLLDAVKMLPLYIHVGARIDVGYIRTCRHTARHLSVQEQIKACAKAMVCDTGIDFQFTLTSLLMDYVKTWEQDNKRIFWADLKHDLKAAEYTFESFKNLQLGGPFLEDVITNVHRLQGHF